MSAVELVQGTEEWLQFRKKRLGASEAAIVLGISPWSTRYELWCEKTGRTRKQKKNQTNFATDRGNRWEPAARSYYELKTGNDFPPDILIHPEHSFIMASLDGYDKLTGTGLEIKCGGKKLFEEFLQGKIPDYYFAQLQHQLMMPGMKQNHYWVCEVYVDKKTRTEKLRVPDTPIVVLPDPVYQKALEFELISFWDFVIKDIAPPLCDRDTVYPEDASTIGLFTRLREAKIKDKDFKAIKKEAIEYIEHEIKHPRVSACGLNMYRKKDGSWMVTLDDVIEEKAA